MPYNPKRGDTLLIQSGPADDPERKHLHGIVTDRCGEELHMVVCVESVGEAWSDQSCLIQIGEHPFINKLSWVNYSRSKCWKASRLTAFVDGWVFRQKEELSPELLGKICAGVLKSNHTPRGLKKYFTDQNTEPAA